MNPRIYLLAILAVAGVAIASDSAEAAQVTLPNEITQNLTLKRSDVYVLEGGTFVRSGATLKIQAGTKIIGTPGSFLVIDVGGRILAKGKAAKPVVFTSSKPEGQRAAGDWGGLVINGRAPVDCGSGIGGTCTGEGSTGTYGGSNESDDSGLLRYVRVEFAGYPITPDNELNAISFQGVGSGGTFDYIEALHSGDDGIEFYGGTVRAKHLVAIGSADDGIDWTSGWSGKIQFGVVVQEGISSDRGLECGEIIQNMTDPNAKPLLLNMTVVAKSTAPAGGGTAGIFFKGGTGGFLRNTIVMGFRREGIVLTGSIDQLLNGTLGIEGLVLYANNGGDNVTGLTEQVFQERELDALRIVDQVNPNLRDPFGDTPDFRPAAGSVVLEQTNVAPQLVDGFFSPAPYVGAFDADVDWTAGWASFAER